MTYNNYKKQNLKIKSKDFYLEVINNKLEKILRKLNNLDNTQIALTDIYFIISQSLEDIEGHNKLMIQKLDKLHK